ncbi:sushi domain-containing protein 3 [Nerophis lumbriciformis]|uniref:sushi domain-containing protein 3 n=1 Tax=Nerophis lumbriciformis TaxID=546530 RepID=UPI003BAA8A1E
MTRPSFLYATSSSPSAHHRHFLLAINGLYCIIIILFIFIMSLTAASRLHKSNLDLTNRSQQNNWVSFQAECPPLPSPTLGTHVVLTGNGSHVGSMVSLLCPSKHKRVGVELTCVMAANKARWVGELHCTPLSVFEGSGFRVAALASIVSIGVISIMSMLFITCCILDCIQKDAGRKQQRQVGFEKVGENTSG